MSTRSAIYEAWAKHERRRLAPAVRRLVKAKQLTEASAALAELASLEVASMQVAAVSAAAHLAEASKYCYRAGDTKAGGQLLEASVAIVGHAMAARSQRIPMAKPTRLPRTLTERRATSRAKRGAASQKARVRIRRTR
jgi:hypothetical protein